MEYQEEDSRHISRRHRTERTIRQTDRQTDTQRGPALYFRVWGTVAPEDLRPSLCASLARLPCAVEFCSYLNAEAGDQVCVV